MYKHSSGYSFKKQVRSVQVAAQLALDMIMGFTGCQKLFYFLQPFSFGFKQILPRVQVRADAKEREHEECVGNS